LSLFHSTRKIDDTIAALKLIKQRFQIEFADMTTIAEYAEFVKSPQYQAWLALNTEP
jgi:hypothetical protein